MVVSKDFYTSHSTFKYNYSLTASLFAARRDSHKQKGDSTVGGECLQGESDVEVGQAHMLNSNYYNSLIINDSNMLEEKTRGCPTVQLFRQNCRQ